MHDHIHAGWVGGRVHNDGAVRRMMQRTAREGGVEEEQEEQKEEQEQEQRQ